MYEYTSAILTPDGWHTTYWRKDDMSTTQQAENIVALKHHVEQLEKTVAAARYLHAQVFPNGLCSLDVVNAIDVFDREVGKLEQTS